jgi:hypothetical protein
MTDSNWQRGGNIVVALILIFLATPEISGNGSYNLSFCNNSDPLLGETYEAIEIENFDFFSCEIGYLEGEMSLKIQLFLSESESRVMHYGENGELLFGSVDILILNHQNYNKFYNGENYGISNIEFLSLKITQDMEDMRIDFASIDLQSDYYFLVLDWCSSSCNVDDYGGEDNGRDNIGISYSIDLKHNSDGLPI